MVTEMSIHMIVMLAGSCAEYLITQTDSLLNAGLGVAVVIGSVALYFLELLIVVLQAFVFSLLSALYHKGAIAAQAEPIFDDAEPAAFARYLARHGDRKPHIEKLTDSTLESAR